MLTDTFSMIFMRNFNTFTVLFLVYELIYIHIYTCICIHQHTHAHTHVQIYLYPTFLNLCANICYSCNEFGKCEYKKEDNYKRNEAHIKHRKK